MPAPEGERRSRKLGSSPRRILVRKIAGVALEDLHALAVELEHVVDGVAVELEVGAAWVLEAQAGPVGEAEGVDGAQEQGLAAEADVGVDDLLPQREGGGGGREQGLDVVERGVEALVDVALVDRADPVDGALVGVHGGELALGVVQLLGAVDAGAQLDAVATRKSSFSSSISEKLLTMVNCSCLPSSARGGWRTRRRGGRPGS
jgi:hypothetical protein